MPQHSEETDEHFSEHDEGFPARKHRRSSEADELQLGLESQSSTASVDQELSCGICLDILTFPYTIISCLHTFDRGCLIEWWKQNSNCPTCKKTSTSAKSAFQLRAIMDHVYKNKRRKLPSPTSGSTSDEIFPFSGGPPATHDEESDDFLTDSELADDDPRNGLVYSCDACIPNNPTGYLCPTPLPSLTPDQLLAAPLPGNRYPRLPLYMAVEMGVPGARDHAHCVSCETYVPLGYPAAIKCGRCLSVYCNNFGEPGCPGAAHFYSRSDVQLIPHTIPTLTTYLPVLLKENRHEVERLISYINARNLSLDDILAALFEAKRKQVVEVSNEELANEHWGPNAWFCYPCVAYMTSSMLYDWWARERSSSLERHDGIVVPRPDCWYGRECRTQTHNDSHADRLNHICENTRR